MYREKLNHHSLTAQKQRQAIQTWYEPALRVLNELLAEAQQNLRQRRYNVANAAVPRQKFKEQLQRRFRIQWALVNDIEKSLLNADKIEMMGSFIKTKAGEQ